jgi:hypothetical protein
LHLCLPEKDNIVQQIISQLFQIQIIRNITLLYVRVRRSLVKILTTGGRAISTLILQRHVSLMQLSAGAYVDDPTITRKVNFGFVSKYNEAANVPEGNTEFQFKVGNLNFNSTS